MTTFTDHEVTYEDGKKKIYYIAAGPTNGPLIIWLHGWPGIAKTWRPQLESFASLGFRVVAPDMPGYGRSTSNKVLTDYAQEVIAPGMVALLADTGRQHAVWAAHDWGSGVLWSFVGTHPHLCCGIISLAVPYRILELGLDELLKYVNRDIYPMDKYPHGQWSYQVFYEQNFDKATAWFDQDPPGILRALYGKGKPESLGQPAITSTVVQDNGWFHGISKPFPKSQIPPGFSALDNLSPSDVLELETAMTKTGFYGADAYYMNHAANRTWILANSVNDGVLEMPVLFIEAKYDNVCDTTNSRLTEPMKKLCKNLTITSIDAGHWVALEKPEETNAAIARWLVEKLPTHWPGYWENAFAGSRL